MVFAKQDAFGILSVVMFGLCAAEKLELPVRTCERNSSDYNLCLKRAIKEAWPLFVKGLPGFEFPPLDPFYLEYQKGVFDRGNIYGEIIVSNITLEGMGDTRFVAVRPHFSDNAFRLEIDIHMPKIFVDGVGEMKATLAGFRMNGKGHFNMTLEGIVSTWDIFGPVKNDTWIIEHFRTLPTTKTFKTYLNDFFEGSREINEIATTFINEYWPSIYRTALPVASEYWDKFFSDLLTRFFAKISFSKLFP